MEIPDPSWKIFGDDFARGLTENEEDVLDVIDRSDDCIYINDCDENKCMKSMCKDYLDSKPKTNRFRKGEKI